MAKLKAGEYSVVDQNGVLVRVYTEAHVADDRSAKDLANEFAAKHAGYKVVSGAVEAPASEDVEVEAPVAAKKKGKAGK